MTKIKFRTPTKEKSVSTFPRNNEDIKRLGWTRIALADMEYSRLKNKQEVEVNKSNRICNVVSLFTWPL